MQSVVVIDYGMGNLRSVAKALEHVASEDDQILVTNDPVKIAEADRIVFPGQGAAKACMSAINQAHLSTAIAQAVAEKPFLGVCMGMQVLLSHSQENQGVDLLNLVPGEVKHFNFPPESHLKVPHMGWNNIHQTQDHPLWYKIPQDAYFYFVHSYYAQPADEEVILGTTHYGFNYTSALGRDNLFAIQAHPEKSATVGLQLYQNFLTWKP